MLTISQPNKENTKPNMQISLKNVHLYIKFQANLFLLLKYVKKIKLTVNEGAWYYYFYISFFSFFLQGTTLTFMCSHITGFVFLHEALSFPLSSFARWRLIIIAITSGCGED